MSARRAASRNCDAVGTLARFMSFRKRPDGSYKGLNERQPPSAAFRSPPGARDLGPRLLRRLLQNGDQDAVSHEVTDRRPFAADDNEHVDIGMRTVLAASGGAIHPDGHEVPTLARTKLARQGLRERKPARGRHVRHIPRGAISLSAGPLPLWTPSESPQP